MLIFEQVQSQWREGMTGITGLDYAAVIPVIKLYVTRDSERINTLQMINWLETGCLTALADNRDKQTKQ